MCESKRGADGHHQSHQSNHGEVSISDDSRGFTSGSDINSGSSLGSWTDINAISLKCYGSEVGRAHGDANFYLSTTTMSELLPQEVNDTGAAMVDATRAEARRATNFMVSGGE